MRATAPPSTRPPPRSPRRRPNSRAAEDEWLRLEELREQVEAR